jgi:hypothetical protein
MSKIPLHAKLNFDVSSGLKSVLGSEMITDDEVAIFELVKNSFDAQARRVDIFFSEDEIVVSDNGNGMSYEDIKEKWLFVAYSSKRETNEEANFRDGIAERKHYAGSKGIGRFSSDIRPEDDNEVDARWLLFYALAVDDKTRTWQFGWQLKEKQKLEARAKRAKRRMALKDWERRRRAEGSVELNRLLRTLGETITSQSLKQAVAALCRNKSHVLRLKSHVLVGSVLKNGILRWKLSAPNE